MSKLYNGGASFGFSLNFNTAVPVDTRFVVATLDDLVDPQTWISGTYDSSNDANNVYVVYPGLNVVVVSEKTMYVFGEETVNGTTIADSSSWTKLATGGSTDTIEETIKKAVESIGLNEDGEHVKTTGNYTSEAETIVEEIEALDTALKTTNDTIGESTDDETKETVFGKIAAEKKAREKAIEDLDSDFDEKDTDEFVNIKITQENGIITKVEVGTNDIASKSSLSDSSTLSEVDGVFEVKAKIKYIPSTESVPAHIALVDKNDTELSTVDISDIIGNGILDSHSYDSVTGKLTLSFKQADGTTKDEEIDLGKMLDIDDVLIDTDSKKYLAVNLTGAEQSQAVFKALIVKMADVSETNTGLADAADVKKYIDDKAAELEITAQGDDYVEASKDTTDSKKIVITTNTADLTITKDGTNNTTISGTEKTLVDGKEIADKVGTFVDTRISEELEKLGTTESNTGADHVTVEITQVEGLITEVKVTESDIASASLLGTTADDKTKETAFGKIAAEKDAREAAIKDLKLQPTDTNAVAKDSKEYIKTTISQTDGIVKNEKVEVTYGSFADNEDGIATVEEVKENIRFEKGTGTNSAILKDNGLTANNEGEVAVGKFNNSVTHDTDDSAKTIFSVGNGTSESDLHNAVEVRENGDIWINLGSDYKKLQTILSNEIDWYEGN